MRRRVAYHRAAMNAPSPHFHRTLAPRPAPELSVVVPTFNAQDNVPLLVEKLARALGGIDWEVIFVDDNSPDRTGRVGAPRWAKPIRACARSAASAAAA